MAKINFNLADLRTGFNESRIGERYNSFHSLICSSHASIFKYILFKTIKGEGKMIQTQDFVVAEGGGEWMSLCYLVMKHFGCGAMYHKK